MSHAAHMLTAHPGACISRRLSKSQMSTHSIHNVNTHLKVADVDPFRHRRRRGAPGLGGLQLIGDSPCFQKLLFLLQQMHSLCIGMVMTGAMATERGQDRGER